MGFFLSYSLIIPRAPPEVALGTPAAGVLTSWKEKNINISYHMIKKSSYLPCFCTY